jgi:hypothetical protein
LGLNEKGPTVQLTDEDIHMLCGWAVEIRGYRTMAEEEVRLKRLLMSADSIAGSKGAVAGAAVPGESAGEAAGDVSRSRGGGRACGAPGFGGGSLRKPPCLRGFTNIHRCGACEACLNGGLPWDNLRGVDPHLLKSLAFPVNYGVFSADTVFSASMGAAQELAVRNGLEIILEQNPGPWGSMMYRTKWVEKREA